MKLRWLFFGIYFCLAGCGDTTSQALAKCEMKEQQVKQNDLSYDANMGICMQAKGFISLQTKPCYHYYAYDVAGCYVQQGYLGGLNQQLLKIL